MRKTKPKEGHVRHVFRHRNADGYIDTVVWYGPRNDTLKKALQRSRRRHLRHRKQR